MLTIKILGDLKMFATHKKILGELEMLGTHKKNTWGARNVWYSQKNTWGARNVWYSQSNPSGFGSGIDWEEPPSRKGILVLPLISCKINHDFDYYNHKLGSGIQNGIY